MKPAAAVAAFGPPPTLGPVVAEIQVATETAGNPIPPREAEAVQIALPARIAARFAAPAHTADDGTSDNGTDVLGGFDGASVGAAPGSGALPGAAIAPSCTGILSTMQAAPGAAAAPQHATVTADVVPLAAVPIAIVARAEEGERKTRFASTRRIWAASRCSSTSTATDAPPRISWSIAPIRSICCGGTRPSSSERYNPPDLRPTAVPCSSRCGISLSPSAIKERPRR